VSFNETLLNKAHLLNLWVTLGVLANVNLRPRYADRCSWWMKIYVLAFKSSHQRVCMYVFKFCCWKQSKKCGSKLNLNNRRSWSENPNSLWFRGCLKAWYFWVGPPRQDQDCEWCDGSALICCPLLGKHERMYYKHFCKYI